MRRKRQRKEDGKENGGEMGTLQSFKIIATLPIWTGVNGSKIASVYKRRTEKGSFWHGAFLNFFWLSHLNTENRLF